MSDQFYYSIAESAKRKAIRVTKIVAVAAKRKAIQATKRAVLAAKRKAAKELRIIMGLKPSKKHKK